MIPPGFTFLSQSPSYSTEHLYIVISPIIDGKVLIVNITTKKPDNDHTCLLQRGDHEFLRHDSIINYGDAFETDVSLIEQALSTKLITPKAPVSDGLLRRIQVGALISEAFKQPFLKYIPT